MTALEVRLILREEMQLRDQAFQDLLQRVEVLEDAIAQQAHRVEDLENRLARLGSQVARGPTVYK